MNFNKSNTMSDYHNIQALLEKYWAGESTLEEERQLKGYFASGNVDERLRQYSPLFQAFREEKAVQLNKNKVVPIRPQMYWAAAAAVAILIAASTWWLFSKPGETIIVADHKKPVEQQQEVPNTATQPETTVIAQTQTPPPKPMVRQKRAIAKKDKAPVINAEEVAAMEEIKAALALVSSKIRKGRHEAAKGAAHLESMDRIFKKKEG
jgi:hypothetical protein